MLIFSDFRFLSADFFHMQFVLSGLLFKHILLHSLGFMIQMVFSNLIKTCIMKMDGIYCLFF